MAHVQPSWPGLKRPMWSSVSFYLKYSSSFGACFCVNLRMVNTSLSVVYIDKNKTNKLKKSKLVHDFDINDMATLTTMFINRMKCNKMANSIDCLCFLQYFYLIMYVYYLSTLISKVLKIELRSLFIKCRMLKYLK